MVTIYTGKRLREFVQLVNMSGKRYRIGWPYKDAHGWFYYEVVERDGEIYPGYKWGIVRKYDIGGVADVSYTVQFGSPRHAAVQVVRDLQHQYMWEHLREIPRFQDALDDIGWPYVRGM